MSALLEVTGLRTHIRHRARVARPVDSVSLSVDEEELLGVVGESGCGKTMTALSLMRLLPEGGTIAGGRISFAGRDLAGASEAEMRRVRGNEIGMVFQDPLNSLNPTMRVGDQIAEAVLLHRNVTRAAARARAIEVLSMVGMPRAAERVDDYAHQLSGGMRQRVMIAMALACTPKLLIADEPTTALDVTVQKQILDLIDDLRHELRMAVILVTHDLGVIAGRADRTAVMYAGQVVETAETEQLFRSPRHRYTQALFAALPEHAIATRARLSSIPGRPPELAEPIDGCRFAPRCRFATDECRASAPELTPDGPGHSYACFHPVTEERVAVEPSETRRAEAMADVEPLLRVSGLVKDFPVTAGAILRRRVGALSAIAGVSFDVPAGRTFGLVGESGCGKSTTGRVIVGLERATGGAVTFAGQDLVRPGRKERRALSREIQLVFQDPFASMDPRMRVGSILAEPLAIQGTLSRPQRLARIAGILDEVGLPATAVHRYPHEFSGGQRQRLCLARALIVEPRMIVADEPVSALDVSVQAQVLNMMKDLQDRRGLTYLFISHDLSVVRYVADTIGVMYLGKLVETGPAEDVYRHPAHPYTRGLIDAVPIADPAAERGRATPGVSGELPSAITPPSGCRFRTRCALAQEVCARVEPERRVVGVAGHEVACHFPLEGVLAG
ncbi:ABC transporter ATP-binding protein [Amycolatopsis jejuensis]|uniref:ABC transporter ATP-binding protein n=1 Tax=Amycolatopsis jejuensis TaxID=330084 RepID=UPI0005273F10|nr:ABC transporter ATP-binding protein [Amycolatopsis jejuensis]